MKLTQNIVQLVKNSTAQIYVIKCPMTGSIIVQLTLHS